MGKPDFAYWREGTVTGFDTASFADERARVGRRNVIDNFDRKESEETVGMRDGR